MSNLQLIDVPDARRPKKGNKSGRQRRNISSPCNWDRCHLHHRRRLRHNRQFSQDSLPYQPRLLITILHCCRLHLMQKKSPFPLWNLWGHGQMFRPLLELFKIEDNKKAKHDISPQRIARIMRNYPRCNWKNILSLNLPSKGWKRDVPNVAFSKKGDHMSCPLNRNQSRQVGKSFYSAETGVSQMNADWLEPTCPCALPIELLLMMPIIPLLGQMGLIGNRDTIPVIAFWSHDDKNYWAQSWDHTAKLATKLASSYRKAKNARQSS